ncbi:hypothetical protein MYMA111404_01380 [Mycoplasma marinum]|uniref:Uncharacterized protein n=1 Tax=Mycoplasma marinum TaxID=1937190 RepID=A0A4R0XLR3_9MOLU|nr:hypothetical protein [Mycoplasma marinum]TCG11424.1 hypothetical protein C4B24_02000 [Mycoplasma marinum]
MNELFKTIPNLKWIYLKSILRTRWITILLDVALPLIQALYFKHDSVSKVFDSWFIAGLVLTTISVFEGVKTILEWNTRYKYYLKPLYDLKNKELAIKFIFDCPLMLTKDLNLERNNFIDSVAITLCLTKRKHFWVIFMPIIGETILQRLRKKIRIKNNVFVNLDFNSYKVSLNHFIDENLKKQADEIINLQR